MERNSLSSSLRDHSINSSNTTTKNSFNNKMMVKDPLNCNNSQQNHCYGGGEDYVSGFSWPPRCYTCSFCKREFRSAQALGGHMNVHRRDRARLRQSPPLPSPPPPPPPNYDHAHYNNHYNYHHHHHHHPILNLNLNLNPNPNPNFSSTSLSPSAISSLVSSSISALSSPSSTSPSELKKWVVDLDPSSDGCNILKTTGAAGDQSVRLNLEIGQVSDSKVDLDLELRLGYC